MSPSRPPAPRTRPPAPSRTAPRSTARPEGARSSGGDASGEPVREAPAGTPPPTAGRAAAAPSKKVDAPTGSAPVGASGGSSALPTAPAQSRYQTATTYQVRRFGGPVRPPVVSTRSVQRFAERARARRTLARRQIALAAAAVLLVGALAWLLLWSPVLALRPADVTVAGAGTVVAVDQVRAVVAKDSGIPLPRLGTVALRDRLLQVPGVREARVTRDWPHGLTVQLVAREPVAAVPEKQAPAGAAAPGFALLDEEGVQVGRADAAPAGLPVVDVPAGDARTLQAVLGVLRQLPPALLAEVAGVAAQTQDTVTMHLRDGVEVDWGSSQETALKVAVLTALRASPTAKGAHVYDVSAPRLPITR